MIGFSTVGTSWITEEFIDALKTCNEAELIGVYSRTEEKAKAFAEKHSARKSYTDLKEMAKDPSIQAVYIASPNSCHAEQAILFMNAGKHVLCEKPIASNEKEFLAMKEAADRNGVLLMEAWKSGVMPGMKAVRENLSKLGIIRGAFVSFGKYSSRYDAHKAGKDVNTFKAEFSNGALMDLGIYCLYPMLHLFGIPEKTVSLATKIPGGVDGMGATLMQYPTFVATLNYNKICNVFLPAQISGEEATMTIDKLNIPEKIEIVYRDKTKPSEIIVPEQRQDSMCYEVEEFLRCLQEGKKQSDINSHALSLAGLRIMDEARKQCGVFYPADVQ